MVAFLTRLGSSFGRFSLCLCDDSKFKFDKKRKTFFRSTSKASYLALRRDRDRERDSVLPNFEGSYKQTVPSGYQRVPPVSVATVADARPAVAVAVVSAERERERERDRVPGRPVARQASAVLTSAASTPDRHFARQVSVGERTQVQQPPVLSRHVSAGQLTSDRDRDKDRDRMFHVSKSKDATGFRPLSHERPHTHQLPTVQTCFGVDDLKSKSLETLPERPPNPLTPSSSTSSSVTLTSEASSGTLSSSSGVHSTTSLSSGISAGALPLATSSPSSGAVVSSPWTAPPSPAPSSPVGTSSAPSSLPVDLSSDDVRCSDQRQVNCSSLSSDSALASTTSASTSTSTSDAASQTDEAAVDSFAEPEPEPLPLAPPLPLPLASPLPEVRPLAPQPPQPPPPPPPTQEELEVERLSRDLARRLPAGGRLHGLLAPDPDSKKPADYIPSLFNLDVAPRRTVDTSTSPIPISTSVSTSTDISTSTSTSISTSVNCSSLSNNSNSPLTHSRENLLVSAAYFATSEPKARLLTRYSNNNCVGIAAEAYSSAELQQKKEELVARLTQKLEVLRAEQLALTEEKALNDELGEAVCARVAGAARPHQATKFRIHVAEVGHITALLLGLSGRLARAENALLGLPQDHVDRVSLEMKRDKLEGQLAEAKQLKASIDERSISVSALLSGCLSSNDFADYQHFINMKAKLIVDARELADKISLGEEQLAALKETLCSPG